MFNRIFHLSLMCLVVDGCSSMRLHDAGRSGTAQEALTLVQEIQQQDSGVFDVMRQNIDVVAKARQDAQQKLDDARYDTFMYAVTEMTADMVLEELEDALSGHLEIMSSVDTGAETAREHVADALARQQAISEIVKVECKDEDNSIKCVIASIDARLDWLESNLENLEKAINAVSGNDTSSDSAIVPDDVSGQHTIAEIKKKIKGAREALKAPLEDPQVKAAKNLLIRAGQEVTLLEQARLLEFRRHLSAVERIQAEMVDRHDTYMDDLILPALYAVDVDRGVEEWEKRNGPLGKDEKDLIVSYVGQWNKDEEKKRDFSQYLEAGLASGAVNEFGRISVDLVQSLALILFVEQYRDERAALALATEQHLHSIYLSEINLKQNIDLVHQITEALQIYYQGGIKPEELAELIILSSQVASLFFIGSEI